MPALHPQLDTLESYRLGSLPDADTRAVSNHLLWCEPCRRTVLEAREIAKLVKSVLEHESVEEYTAGAVPCQLMASAAVDAQ